MNIPAVFLLLLIIASTLFIAERLARAGILSLVLSRKLVHVVAVGTVAISPAFFFNHLLLKIIIAVFICILLWAVKTNKLAIDDHRRKSWGIALFPISFLVLYCCFGNDRPWLVVYPMLVLAVADAAAAIAGETLAKRYFFLTGDRKSFIGSLAFAVTTILVLYASSKWLISFSSLFDWPLAEKAGSNFLPLLICIALVAALAEALGSGGTDNLTVPFAVAWMMWQMESSNAVSNFALAFALVLVFGWVVWRRKWLDLGGAVCAALLGIMVLTIAGWVVAIPILLFFLTGSLLGKLPRKTLLDAKHNQPRDFAQVVSNGGVTGLLLLVYAFYPNPAFLHACLVSIAISTADTWSSEIGQWAGGRVVDIATFKRLSPGLSGGISWQGSLGGLAGGLLIGLCAMAIGSFPVHVCLIITAAGFLGMLADSWLGSRFQAKYLLADGHFTEDSLEALGLNPVKGLAWMNNDRVNLFSNLIITGAVLAILLLA